MHDGNVGLEGDGRDPTLRDLQWRWMEEAKRVGVAERASVCYATIAYRVALCVGGSIGNMCHTRLPSCSRRPPRERVSQSFYAFTKHFNSSIGFLALFVPVWGLRKDSIDEFF